MPATPIIRTSGSISGVVTGTSRNDGDIGETFTIDDTQGANTGATYQWVLEDVPIGSSTVVNNPTSATATFVPDRTGSYRLRCTVGAFTSVIVVAVPLPSTGGIIPSFEEKLENNTGGNSKGWHRWMSDWMRSVDTLLAGVGAIADVKAKVSATDTTADYLEEAILVTSGHLTKTKNNVGANETLTFGLPNVGPGAGNYGGGGAYVSLIGIDAQGRVTTVNTSTPAAGAPTGAGYWVSDSTDVAGLSAEQRIGALADGIIKHASGVPARAVPGTDYENPLTFAGAGVSRVGNTVTIPGGFVPGAANRIPYGNAGATALTDSASLTFVDTTKLLTISDTLVNELGIVVENTNNSSATGSAVVDLKAGGASGGDAFIRFSVNGAGNSTYVLGVDNSDSDTLKLQFGGLPNTGLTNAGVYILSLNQIVGVGTISPSVVAGQFFQLNAAAANATSGVGGWAKNSNSAGVSRWGASTSGYKSASLFSMGSTAAGTTLGVNNTTGVGGVTNDAPLAVLTSVASSVLLGTDSTLRLELDAAGNVVVGTGALTTTAADGYLYITTSPGAPTVAPTAKTGRAPVHIDSSGNALYFYSTGAWRSSSGGGFTPGAANRMPFGNSGGTALTDSAKLTFVDGTNTMTVSAASIGGTVSVIAENTDNTNTASHAFLQSKVGGPAGGNPQVALTIPGGTSWNLLVNNTSSDAFEIWSAGNTKQWAVGTTGTVSFQNTQTALGTTYRIQNSTANAYVAGNDSTGATFGYGATNMIVIDASNMAMVATGLRMRGRFHFIEGTAIASASTITIPGDASGSSFNVTGTTTINHITQTGFATGGWVILRFASAGCTITHNAGSPPGGTGPILTATGANITSTAGMVLQFRFDGTNFVEVGRVGGGSGFSPGAAKRIPYGNSGGTALTDSAEFMFDPATYSLTMQGIGFLQMNNTVGAKLDYNGHSLAIVNTKATLAHSSGGVVELDSGNVSFKIGASYVGFFNANGFAVGASGSFGGGVGVVAIKNATTAPSSAPSGGGLIWAEGGSIKAMGASGVPITLAS